MGEERLTIKCMLLKGGGSMKVFFFKSAIVFLIFTASFLKPVNAADELSAVQIRILEISPPSGATIDEQTIIRAKLEYKIKDFRPDSSQYTATVQFDTMNPGGVVSVSRTVNDDDNFQGKYKIINRTGEFQFNYPISLILNRKDIADPIRLRFVINEANEDNEQSQFFKDFFKEKGGAGFFKSKTIGRTATVHYVPTFSSGHQAPDKQRGEKRFERMGGISPFQREPSLIFHNITINPTPVPAGSRFEVIVEYTVTESSGNRLKIPVSLWYEIYSEDQRLYEKGPIEIMSVNGKGMRRIEPVQAPKRTGSYRLTARLGYEKEIRTRSMPFRIGDQGASLQPEGSGPFSLREIEE
jgi:hypothetical protein